jgi:Ca2+-binding EF-hand superfamily protein
LQKLDANGDRTLEKAEVPEQGQAAFERLLKRGDANQDGKLEGEEIRSLMAKLRPLAAGRDRVRALDRDGDGKVSRVEFRGPAALFERLDRDGDGTLSNEEQSGMTRPRLGNPAGPLAGRENLAKRLARFDKNNDGSITRDEYTGPAPLFDRLDSNADGTISGEELKSQGGSDSAPATKPEAKNSNFGKRFAVMDKDSDGKISREEFSGNERLFRRLDSNKDGAISAEESRQVKATDRPESAEPEKPGAAEPRTP